MPPKIQSFPSTAVDAAYWRRKDRSATGCQSRFAGSRVAATTGGSEEGSSPPPPVSSTAATAASTSAPTTPSASRMRGERRPGGGPGSSVDDAAGGGGLGGGAVASVGGAAASAGGGGDPSRVGSAVKISCSTGSAPEVCVAWSAMRASSPRCSPTAASTAAASSEARPYRSSGSFAVARATTSSNASTSSGRLRRGAGQGSWTCAHSFAMSLSLGYATSPASISSARSPGSRHRRGRRPVRP